MPVLTGKVSAQAPWLTPEACSRVSEMRHHKPRMKRPRAQEELKTLRRHIFKISVGSGRRRSFIPFIFLSGSISVRQTSIGKMSRRPCNTVDCEL